MANIWENKFLAVGMLLFWGTKILVHLPLLSQYAGRPIDEFLSGVGVGLVITGILIHFFGDRLQTLKQNLFSKAK